MSYYIYYSNKYEVDIAIVESDSKEDAIQHLKQYYTIVTDEMVQKIDCHRDGYPDGIMIISSY